MTIKTEYQMEGNPDWMYIKLKFNCIHYRCFLCCYSSSVITKNWLIH
jgi:hypothetical protein